MSQAEEFYRRKIVDRVLVKLKEYLGSHDAELTPEELAHVEQELRKQQFPESFGEGWVARYERHELEAFIKRLLHRQGTHLPDFGFLYEKKAELDRKLLGP